MYNHPVAKPESTTRFVVSKKCGDPKTLKQWDFWVPPIPPPSLWETHRWRIFSPNSPMSHTCLNRQQAVSQVRDAALVAPVAGLDLSPIGNMLWSLFDACFHGNCQGWFNLPCWRAFTSKKPWKNLKLVKVTDYLQHLQHPPTIIFSSLKKKKVCRVTADDHSIQLQIQGTQLLLGESPYGFMKITISTGESPWGNLHGFYGI